MGAPWGASASPAALKGEHFRIFNIHSVAKYQKIARGLFGEKKFEKSLTISKKLEGGPFNLNRNCMLR